MLDFEEQTKEHQEIENYFKEFIGSDRGDEVIKQRRSTVKENLFSELNEFNIQRSRSEEPNILGQLFLSPLKLKKQSFDSSM